MLGNEELESTDAIEKELAQTFGAQLTMRFGEIESDDSSSTSGSSGSDDPDDD